VLVKSLDLKEFRGVRKLSKPIELEDFTVLIGRNNVGKTSILEALYLLAWPFQSAITIPPYSASPCLWSQSFMAAHHRLSMAM